MNQEEVIAKIQLLLEKADPDKNDNENEINSCMSLVFKLLSKYSLDLSDIPALERPAMEMGHLRCAMGVAKVANFKWCKILGAAIAKACFCKVIIAGTQREHIFVGRPEEIEICKLVYTRVMEQMKAYCKHHREELKIKRMSAEGNEFINQFMLGCALGLQQRIETEWLNLTDSQAMVFVGLQTAQDKYAIEKIGVKPGRVFHYNTQDERLLLGASVASEIDIKGNQIK